MATLTDDAKVRTLIGDTDSSNYVFSTDEIGFFLAEGVDIYAAAALAILCIINSKALLARRTKLYGYETEEQYVRDLMILYDRLIGLSPNMGGIVTGEFALNSDDLNSWKPEWIPDPDTGIGITYP